jgi:hypothetical protein
MPDLFLTKLSVAKEEKTIPSKYIEILKGFYTSYLKSKKNFSI